MKNTDNNKPWQRYGATLTATGRSVICNNHFGKLLGSLF